MKRYSRAFTFGCSLTNYAWPTWADIIIHAMDGRGENWGIAGSGNVGVLNRFIEANVRHQFTEDDLIIVMWTSPYREDRYVNGQWYRHGNVYTSPHYDPQFMERHWDDRGAVIKSMNAVAALGAMSPSSLHLAVSPFVTSEHPDLYGLYGGQIAGIRGTMTEFFGEWKPDKVWTQPKRQEDYHPLPRDQLRFAEHIVAPKIGLSIPHETRMWLQGWHERAVAAQSMVDTLWGGDATFEPASSF